MSTQNIGIKLTLDGKEYEATLNTMKAKTKDYATQATGIDRMSASWGKLALGLGAAYVAWKSVTSVVSAFMKPAMDAEEAASKFNTIFGQQSAAVREWATTYGEQIGRSSLALQSFVTDMMAIVSPMGVTRESAIEMSEGLTQAAQDIASFHNVDVSEAFNALRSGITGETEPLKRFSILLTDAAMQEYALAQGIRTKVSEMSIAEKTSLRYKMILAKMGDATGDAARTSGSLTNQLRSLDSTISDLMINVGSNAVPGVTDLITGLNMLAQSDQGASGALASIAGGIGGLTGMLGRNLQVEAYANQIRNLEEELGILDEGIGSFAMSYARYIEEMGIDAHDMEDMLTTPLGKIQAQFMVTEYKAGLLSGALVNRYGSITDALTHETDAQVQQYKRLQAEMGRLQSTAQQSFHWNVNTNFLRNAVNVAYGGMSDAIQQQQQALQTQQQARSQQASQAWASQHKSLLQGLQGTWANYYTTIGSQEQAQLATLTQSTQQQVTQWQQLQQHRLVTASQASQAITDIENQSALQRQAIQERMHNRQILLDDMRVVHATSAQNQAVSAMATTQQEFNAQLEYLYESGRIAHSDYINYQMSLDDARYQYDAQIQQAMYQNKERSLRAQFGLDSRAWKATAMFAQAGATLMNSENKALFNVGKVASVANIAMSTAEAVMKGYAMLGPILGSAYAGIMVTVGSLQANEVRKQKPPEDTKVSIPSAPSFAVGAWQLPSDIKGATVHKDEMIIPKTFADSVREGEATIGTSGAMFNLNFYGNVYGMDDFTDQVSSAINTINRRTGATIGKTSLYG